MYFLSAVPNQSFRGLLYSAFLGLEENEQSS